MKTWSLTQGNGWLLRRATSNDEEGDFGEEEDQSYSDVVDICMEQSVVGASGIYDVTNSSDGKDQSVGFDDRGSIHSGDSTSSTFRHLASMVPTQINKVHGWLAISLESWCHLDDITIYQERQYLLIDGVRVASLPEFRIRRADFDLPPGEDLRLIWE